MRKQLPKTVKECHDLIYSILDRLDKLESKLKEKDEEISELKDKLSKNSRNSSKPPSTDIVKQKSGLKKSKKENGGQKGHKGDTLKFVEEVDIIKKLPLKKCSCGGDLKKENQNLVSKRQVFDIPYPEMVITEYQQMGCLCKKCGKKNMSKYPEDVKAATQYGSGLKTLVCMLINKFHLSWQRTRELINDLYGYSINGNTISRILKQVYKQLEPVEEQIKEAVIKSEVVHADETGFRVKGKRMWLQNASTNIYTYIFHHESRGSKAMKSSASILPAYTGILVHDCYASYFRFENMLHSICGAHICRELFALMEKESKWAEEFRTYLFELLENKKKGKVLTKRQKAWKRYDEILKRADDEEPSAIQGARGKPKKSKGRNLMDRLKKHKIEMLRFALNPIVPFTNNQAERDIRHVKIKQKNAGCFRTVSGASIYCRVNSFLSSTRKQDLNPFDILMSIIEGNKFSFTS